MPTTALSIPQDQIATFCRKWQITELALFGSVLRSDFRPDSDIDILVRFGPDTRPTLFDMVRMQRELETILGHRVDLVSRRAIEASRNASRRTAILESAEVVYAA